MNGTIDLRTGTLRPHRRDDLITKIDTVKEKCDEIKEVVDNL